MQMPAPLFDAGIRIGFGINGPLWLISIVVTFYAVLPLIARPFYRHPLQPDSRSPQPSRSPGRNWSRARRTCSRA